MYDRKLTRSVLERLRALRDAITGLIRGIWGCSGCLSGLLFSLLLLLALGQMSGSSGQPSGPLVLIGGAIGLGLGLYFGSLLAEQIVVWIDWAHQMLAGLDVSIPDARETAPHSSAIPSGSPQAAAGRFRPSDRGRSVGFSMVQSADPLQQHPVIIGIEAGSPAEKAGIRVGDLLTRVDGVEVTKPHDVPPLIAAHQPGEEIRLTVRRSAHTLSLVARLPRSDS